MGAAGVGPAHDDPLDAAQHDPDRRVHLQAEPDRRRGSSSDGLGRCDLRRRASSAPTARARHLLLFGAFLIWAVADLVSSYARDRRNATVYPTPNWAATISAIVLGVVLWVALLWGLHLWLFGVSPMAMCRTAKRELRHSISLASMANRRGPCTARRYYLPRHRPDASRLGGGQHR